MSQISILGCGWLGLPLAKSLLEKGYSVKGSTTSIEKISILKNEGITPFQISLGEDKIEGEIEMFLANSEILIIDIPPKLRGDSKENFVGKIQTLVPFIEKSPIKKIKILVLYEKKNYTGHVEHQALCTFIAYVYTLGSMSFEICSNRFS